MEIVLTSLAFMAAALCAGVMGYAIQRGGTCTVAAVEEVVDKRRFNRLTALAEASLWVAGGLVLAQSLDLLGQTPAGYAVSQWTVVGGALLGLGAWVNRACVFGAIARFGSGEWAYVATPIGFYVGCVSVGIVFAPPAPHKLAEGSPVLQASWAALPIVAFAAWRLMRLLYGVRSVASARDVVSRVWSPHAATIVIGIAFVFMLLLVGSWAYTEALADLARGMSMSLVAKIVLLLALFLGALWGGWTAGRFRSTRVSTAQLLRCFAGGVLMGWGSLLIPGANDGLILIGMPLLWPYAWLAFLTMCVSIGAALLAQKALVPRLASR
jgi:Sulphur transport